jgi:hypothetical protein
MAGGEGQLMSGVMIDEIFSGIDGSARIMPAEAMWTAAAQSEDSGFTQIETNELPAQTGLPADTNSLADLTSQPPDDAPTGTRVPEPATLVFVGTGLIAISRASRMKPPGWNFFRRSAVAAPINCPASR